MDAIKELILQDIETTLATINSDNAYTFSFAAIHRITSAPYTNPVFPFAIIAEINEVKEEGNPAQFTNCTLAITVQFWNSDCIDLSQAAIEIACSIEKAVSQDPTRGGYAGDTDCVSHDTYAIDESSPYGGGSVNFVIRYRHRLGDPFTQI